MMLNNASNVKIKSGNFTNVAGNVYVNDYTSERHGFKLLLDNIVKSAFHNAAERGDPPRCHEGTRKMVLAEIMAWIKSPEAREKFLLWLYGPAGAGKSAIAQSIAEACEQEGLLAASFFFSRSAAGRDNSSKFIATLSYQLSRCIPEMCEHLFTAIEKDPTIFDRSLSIQMQVLVIKPIKAAQPDLGTQITRFVVVDGIDEIQLDEIQRDGRAQAELIRVLGIAVTELRHLPLIFLIGSRPEYEIRQAFNKAPLAMLAKGMPLDDNYQPDEDIKIYLNSMFEKIKVNQLEIGNHLPSEWPSEADVDYLVEKSSGQFIFAATVMNFIDSSRHDPIGRLNIILDLSIAGGETPFALLDALYRFILSSVADLAKVMSILTVLALATDYRDMLFVDIVEDLLGFGVRTALIDMHALVFIPPPQDTQSVIRIHHASMYDFLLDESRSQEYFVDAGKGDITLTRQWIKAIGNYPHSLTRKRLKGSRELQIFYFVDPFMTHCRRIPVHKEVADDLAVLNLGAVLDEIAGELLAIYLSSWEEFLQCAQRQGKDRVDVYPRLQNQIDGFFLHRLSQYPQRLQSHIPALFCCFNSWEYTEDVFEILLHVGHPGMTELEHLRKTDKQLLHLQDFPDDPNPFFANFFKDKTRAGKYYVDGGNYARLAKEIIEVIFSESDEDARQVRLVNAEQYNKSDDISDPNIRIPLYKIHMPYLADILSQASQDSNLAQLLEDRFFQDRSYHITDDPDDLDVILKRIKRWSERYLKTCGISPYTDRDDVSVFSDGSTLEPPPDDVNHTVPVAPAAPPISAVPVVSGSISVFPETLPTVPAACSELPLPARTSHLVESRPAPNPLNSSIVELEPPPDSVLDPQEVNESHTSHHPPRDNISIFGDGFIVEPPPDSALDPGHTNESHTLYRPPSTPGPLHTKTATGSLVEKDPISPPIHSYPSHRSVAPSDRDVKKSIWSRLCPCLE